MNYFGEELDDQVKGFLYSFVVWWALFTGFNERVQLEGLGERKQKDLFNRIVSILHGQLSFWGSCYLILYERVQFYERNNSAMDTLMLVSSAYMAYDILICIYYELYDHWLVFHHFVSVLAFAQSLVTKQGGSFIVYGIFVTEISNLPMHVRHIIGLYGMRLTRLYECIEGLYFGLFIIFRGLLSPYLLVAVWSDVYSPLLIKISAFGLMLYSVYYIFEMIKITRRKIRFYRERKRKNIQLFWFSVNPELLKQGYREIIDPIL